MWCMEKVKSILIWNLLFQITNILNIKPITIDKNYIFDIIRLINKERHSVTGGKMIIK